MRLIVACDQCKRQFDASGHAIGSHFHCYCGTLVTVAQPAAHEAAVVRCSGCGAPRGRGSTCAHCQSSFAAFEQDLGSICPHCLTRVSDRARYCHSCSRPLAAEGSVGELADARCPACEDQRMHSRRLGDELSLLECSGCGGLWLGRETFEHVIHRAEDMVTALSSTTTQPREAAKPGLGQPVRYRPCPSCKALMNRSQYGKFSRVIIDTCKEHGVWLDAGELTQILEWVRDGGLERSRKAQHERRVQELRMEQGARSWGSSGGSGSVELLSDRGSSSDSLLLSLFRWF